MSDVETIREFAKFRAARRWSSATDIFDEAETPTVASTHAHAAQLYSEPFLPALVWVGALSRSLTGNADIELSESTHDEAPLSDFEALDELRSPKGRIRAQIKALGIGLPYREHLARRLEVLLGALEEEGEEWRASSHESLRQMLLFLQEVPDFRCPTVTVTPSATFRAQWQAGGNQHFAVDFLHDGQARFVVFAPDPRHPARVQRVSGVVSRPEVMRVVEPYKVRRWAADARP